MAERRTSVRLAVVGGSEMRAELMGIGADGQRSLEGIGRGAQSAGAGLQLLDGTAAAARGQIASLRGQTGNLAAQFNDIGVQLAGGQSPFLIALQQGSQITQVLGPMGARGAVAALGGAFASLLNPVSLATIGIIAAGGMAFNYFSTLLSDGAKSTEELERQRDQIAQVAREWGDAVPALREYVDELERAQSVAARDAAVAATLEDLAGRQVERFEELYESIRNVLPLVPEAQREFGVLAGEVRSGVATSEDFDRVIRALAAAIEDEASPAIERAISVLATMRDETAATAVEMANLAAQATTAASRIGQVFTGGGSMAPVQNLIRGTGEWIAEQERLNGLTSEQISLESEIGRLRRDAKEAGAAVTDQEIERLAQERIAAEERRRAEARAAAATGRGGGGGRNAALREANELNRDAERIIRSVRTATEEYNTTLADLKRLLDAGAISQEIYGRAAAEAEERLAARTATEREAALAESGDPFEGARAGMQEYADATLSTAEAVKNAMVDAFDASEEALLDFLTTGKAGFKDFANAIIEDILRIMIRTQITGPIANILTSAFSAGFSGGPGAPRADPGIANALAGRAAGGPISAGIPYMVGERGPEMIVPQSAGTVIPNHKLGGGPSALSISVNVSGARGNSEIRDMVQQGVTQGLRAYDARLADRVAGINADPRFRG